MRLALKATCITTLAILLAAEAQADTTVSTTTTAPLVTSTAGNITITADGSIVPTVASTAITINSNNTVTSAGKITYLDLNNSAAIDASAGVTSSITNSGTISLDETYIRTDTNADGVLDGPYANGTNRYGIRTDGAFNGAINNTGAITVRGNNSAAIFLGGPLTGNFTTNTGAITVTGDNDFGIRLGAVTGNVAVSSGISILGGNSPGLALTGDVSGQVVVHSSITTTGYGATTLPTDITKLTPQNLEQGGSAMIIGGNVAGGVLIAAAPTDTTNTTADVDKDGIPDAGQSTSNFITYGTAPALLVGSSNGATTLGVFQGNTNGLIINGNVSGVGVYSGISATGVQIGGLGQPVTVNGGIAIGGSVAGSANGALGVGLHLSSGVTTPLLTVSGSIAGAASATAGGTSVGVQIDAGANLPSIVNTGQISATTTAATGISTAILDKSGTLNSVTNSGTIIAASTDASGRAIDVSGRTTAFTYTQALATATQTSTPGLAGAVVTGSGNDVINIQAGLVNSKMNLGAGNDTIALSGITAASIDATLGDGDDAITISSGAAYSGPVDFGAGNNSLTVNSGSAFFGQFNSTTPGNIAVVVNNGTLAFNTTKTSTMSSLAVAGGTLGVVVDPSTGDHTLINVTGATAITAPTTLKVSVTKFGVTANPITVLQSGTLAGSSNLTLSIDGLPYLLKGVLATSDAAGTVGVGVVRKSATELDLRQSEAAAYDAVFAAISGNAQLSNLFLGFTDRDSTMLRYREMLPDHQGGVFDVLSQGSRALAPTEAATPWAQLGRVSLWVQQAIWDEHQDANLTPGNGGSGWGLTGGGDVAIGDSSRIGLSIGYIHGSVRDSGDNEVAANQFGGGVHWLSDIGSIHLAAYANAGYVRLHEKRFFSGTTDTSAAVLTSVGSWNGLNAAAGAKVSYEAKTGVFYVRPSGELTYNRLSEGSHTETGGGTAFDLTVDKRTSDEFAATGLLAAGVHLGNTTDPDAATFRFELQGGRRQILSSNLDGTTAHFAGGNDFTLLPEDRKSGWIGGVTGSVGSSSFRFIASGQYETRSDGQRIMSGRFGFRGSF
jgi:hypothetical protein